MNKYILCLLTIAFLISCSDNNETVQIEGLTVIDSKSLNKEDIIIKNAANIEFLKLETSDSCRFGDVNRLVIDKEKDRIFIMNTRNSIFIFDLKGKYINKITSYGYYFDRYFFDDFFIDKENEILGFADCNKRRIFYFSYSGEFLSEKWIKKEIIEQATQYFLINENTMLLTQINNNNSVFNYRIVDIDKNTYEDCIPFMMTGQLSLIINYPKIPVNNTILLSSIFSDTIYRYDRTDNVIKPAYFFKNKLKPAKREYFGGDYELATHAAFTAEKNGISHGIKELRTTRNYINFIYLMKKKYYNLFYNTDTNTGYYSETNWDNIYSILFCWGKTSTDDAFVSVIEPDKIIYLKSLGEKKWNQLINTVENEELKNIILNTDIDDNPILLFYKFD